MTTARKTQISLDDTPTYHCISRCVRRAFLCGKDDFSGQDYEHRRQWIVDKLLELSKIFAIKTYAYAVMHNHTHTVLCVDRDQALTWTEAEIIERWSKLYSCSVLVSRYKNGDCTSGAESRAAIQQIEEWRSRLYDISWFMRNLNEYIARKANKEDGCTGRFWEGRFKTQALLDEAAVLACMAYVDLNPIRAGIAETPETSDYTSIQARIQALSGTSEPCDNTAEATVPTPEGLAIFTGNEHIDKPQEIPFALTDYLQLADWTGRAIRSDKAGAIPSNFSPILERLNINPEAWVDNIQHYGGNYYRAVGTTENIKRFSKSLSQNWLCGVRASLSLFKAVPT